MPTTLTPSVTLEAFDLEAFDLRPSANRKTAVLLNAAGDRSAIPNALNLPAGRPKNGGTCPGATLGIGGCEGPCYAFAQSLYMPDLARLERKNLEALRQARTVAGMARLLLDMLDAFDAHCSRVERRTGAKVERFFRMHASGDVWSKTYARAIRHAVEARPQIRVWIYTRTAYAVDILEGLENLALYYSGDAVNREQAEAFAARGVPVAWLAETFKDAADLEASSPWQGPRAVACPEPSRIRLEGACLKCKVCILGRRPVLFSTSDR